MRQRVTVLDLIKVLLNIVTEQVWFRVLLFDWFAIILVDMIGNLLMVLATFFHLIFFVFPVSFITQILFAIGAIDA